MNRSLTVASIAVAIVTIAASGGRADSSDHLLASWSFDEGDGTVVLDASGNGHNGQIRAGEAGARPTRVNGMVGQAMRFRAAAGTDVLVRKHARLNPTFGLTVTAWIKHEGPIGNFAGRRNAMPFNGLIDEVNLFDAALDPDAIFDLARPNRLQQ